MSVYLQKNMMGTTGSWTLPGNGFQLSYLRFRDDPGDPLDVIHYVHWVDIQTMSKI